MNRREKMIRNKNRMIMNNDEYILNRMYII